ncbi:MAG: glycosyltransferase family 9 protein [bacterium]
MKIPADLAPGRVLVLRPRGLGDIVISSAVLDALTRAFPGAAIDYVAEAPARGLLETDARLAGIFLLGPSLPRAGGDARVSGGGTSTAIRWIRARRPDVVLDLFSNPHTALLTGLSTARWRVGLDRGARRLAYNVRVPRFRGAPETDARWAGEAQLDVLRDAGIRWAGEARSGVALTGEDRRFAADALRSLGYAEGAHVGGVLPAGTWATKRWTTSGYVAAARELARGTGVPALVLWGPPERDEAQAIASALGDAARLSPPTTIRQMAALLGRLALLVAPDCLGRHIAIVEGVPTLGVFGSTDPHGWTPPSGPHRAVRADEAQGGLRRLPPEPVLAELAVLLRSGVLDTPSPRP